MTADEIPSEPSNPKADDAKTSAKSELISSDVPVSTFVGPVAGLSEKGIIGPPTRPGLLGILDRFELLRVLGAGGMGTVFLARETETGRTVAVKMLRPEFVSEPRVVQRFITEARHLQRLKHPNLVPVLEARELKQGAFFVMPYFERGSLAQMIKSGAPLGIETILAVAQSVAEALRFAHSKGIIHRDIKPGNILIGQDGSAFLGDFGLARSLFNDAVIDVERDQCEGTAPYMSPAVAAGEAEDTRCDVYGLGAVLYEMLTGVPPYQGPTTRAIRDQIVAGQPRPILELNPSADPRLLQVAGWAMEREHRNRYANMADLAADLQLVATGKPPLGPHGLVRTIRFPLVRLQPRAKWAVCLATIGALLAVAVWILWPRVRLEVVRTLNAPQVTSWVEAAPAQWDGLPGKDLLVTEKSDLLAFTSNGGFLKEWACPDPKVRRINVSMITRFESNRLDDAFVDWAEGTNLSLALINCNAHVIKQFQARGREPNSDNPGATSRLAPLRFLPAQTSISRRPSLIAEITTAYGGNPRAICCFDFETTDMLWELPVGPILRGCEPIGSSIDGFKALICGSISVGNGNQAPDGTDDEHAYAFAFSIEGKELWHRELAGLGALVTPIVAGFDQHKGPVILAWVHNDEELHGQSAPEIGHIVQLDSRGDIVNEVHLGACLKSCVIADLKEDGHKTVFCTDCKGYLHVLDEHLKETDLIPVSPIAQTNLGKYGHLELHIIGPAKLVRGRGKQLVLTSTRVTASKRENPGRATKEPDVIRFEGSKIILLDSGLRPLAEFAFREKTSGWAFGWVVKTADMDGDGLDEILSLSDRVEILKMQ